MRTSLLALVLVLGLGAPALAVPAVELGAASSVVSFQEAPPAQPQAPSLNIDVDTDEGAWYASPVWIAIGVLALVLIIALIVMAGRGGTTVVR
jgi:hypothetical protein